MSYNPLNPNGQASMAGSQPVVIASNQSPVSVLATITGNPSISGTVTVVQTSSANLLARIQGISADGAVPSQPVTMGGVGLDGLSHGIKTDNLGNLVASVSGTVVVSSLISIPAIVSAANSTATPVTSTLSFTGTGEEWKDFGSIVINVFSDAVSATDGLSIQQSSDNSNWDIRDTYTVPSMVAGGGKTFQVQPAARFGRVVYTQGAQNSGAFRLQTIYHPQMVKPTSQRAQDDYSNETDLEQVQTFGMLYNGTNWDRWRGNSSIGALVSTGSSSVIVRHVGSLITVNQSSSILAVPVGSVITVFQAPSIVGTYAEDAPSASGDKGFLVMGARNDTLASVTSADGDYSSHVVGPSGELIAANAPFTKWVSGTASMLGGTPITGSLVPIIPAQGSSTFTYITGVQIANASGTNAWITLFGATNSVVGYTVAPANGGSNIYFQNGLKTNANAAFSASVSTVSSVYLSAQGFISKT